MRRTVALWLVAVTIGCSGNGGSGKPSVRNPRWAVPVKSEHLSNFYKINENLYRSAQPSSKGMRALRDMGIKTIVNLNPIMIDGTGMCGVCRVTVGKKTRFACVDGPDFDAHEVDWDELFQRRRSYIVEEAKPLRTSGSEKHKCMSKKAGS